MPWQVILIRPPRLHSYRDGFFPRRYHYKKDAEEMKREIASLGGIALVEKVPSRLDPATVKKYAEAMLKKEGK